MITIAKLIKYVLEGIAVAIAAYFIPQTKTEPMDILCIGLTAAATFMVLDLFAPSVGASARQGAGLGVGLNQVGWQMGGENNKNEEEVTVSTSDESSEEQ